MVVLYLAMYSDAIVALFIDRICEPMGAKVSSVLILVATSGSVFAILPGYSRVRYAAAADVHFLRIFARQHTHGSSLAGAVIMIGVPSAIACIFSLSGLISMLIVVQTMLQFMLQCVAVIVLRRRDVGRSATFRMPFFPPRGRDLYRGNQGGRVISRQER